MDSHTRRMASQECSATLLERVIKGQRSSLEKADEEEACQSGMEVAGNQLCKNLAGSLRKQGPQLTEDIMKALVRL